MIKYNNVTTYSPLKNSYYLIAKESHKQIFNSFNYIHSKIIGPIIHLRFLIPLFQDIFTMSIIYHWLLVLDDQSILQLFFAFHSF